jgi:hypothetical protein
MKNLILFFIISLSFSILAKAQVPPEAFNYSAIARDASGQPITSSTIGIQISILKTSVTGNVQYSENHFVTTDAFGLFNLVIGTGAVQSGSISTIVWANDNYFVKVGMDVSGGTNFLTMGNTQLLSVPYAMHTKTAQNGFDRISNNGDTIFLNNGQFFVLGNNVNNTSSLVMPTLVTNSISGISSNSATFNAIISNALDYQIIEKGFVYSTSPNPNLNSNKIQLGSGIINFNVTTDLLNPLFVHNTTYYVRSYVITENTIPVYGNEVSFTTLEVGQIGQGGGTIFFDKGIFSNGWRYLEITNSDQSNSELWGCDGFNIQGTTNDVGSGQNNTSIIVSACNEIQYASKLCDNLTLGGQNDWFLPSTGVINLIYVNSLNNSLNFSNAFYWTSTSFDANYAWCFNGFQGLMPNSTNKYQLFYIRAVRAF